MDKEKTIIEVEKQVLLSRERSEIFGGKKRQRGEITEDSDRHCNYRKNIGKRVDAVFNSLLPAEAGANIESLNDSIVSI